MKGVGMLVISLRVFWAKRHYIKLQSLGHAQIGLLLGVYTSKFPMSIPAHFIWESHSTGSVQNWTAFRLSSQLGRVFLTACYLNGPRALMSQAEEVW